MKGRREERKAAARPVPVRVRVRGRVRVRRHERMCMRAHFRLRLATDPGRFDFLTCLMLDRSLMLGVKIAGRSHSCSLHTYHTYQRICITGGCCEPEGKMGEGNGCEMEGRAQTTAGLQTDCQAQLTVQRGRRDRSRAQQGEEERAHAWREPGSIYLVSIVRMSHVPDHHHWHGEEAAQAREWRAA